MQTGAMTNATPPPVASELDRLGNLPDREIAQVATAAAADAGLDRQWLDGAIESLLRAIRTGAPSRDLDRFRAEGERAAIDGVPLPALLDLHLSAAWRLWRVLISRETTVSPTALGELGDVVLRSADEVVAALSRGYGEAQRQAIRREESARREFVDDLLSGTADPTALEAAAEAFGVSLSGRHIVAVGRAHRPLRDAGPIQGWVESQVFSRFGTADVVVATKEGLLVCVFPARAEDAPRDLAAFLGEASRGPWRVAVGREESGPSGPARSYRQATETLRLVERLDPSRTLAMYDELLPYHVLSRDRSALGEMVEATLGGLDDARGGSEPLIATLEAYFATGGNTSETARRLFLTPRAVTYRLETIAKRTGRSVQAQEDRFVLELAVRGRRLLAERPID
jgi:DNA-binding PucR family transcriptional regulator